MRRGGARQSIGLPRTRPPLNSATYRSVLRLLSHFVFDPSDPLPHKAADASVPVSGGDPLVGTESNPNGPNASTINGRSSRNDDGKFDPADELLADGEDPDLRLGEDELGLLELQKELKDCLDGEVPVDSAASRGASVPTGSEPGDDRTNDKSVRRSDSGGNEDADEREGMVVNSGELVVSSTSSVSEGCRVFGSGLQVGVEIDGEVIGKRVIASRDEGIVSFSNEEVGPMLCDSKLNDAESGKTGEPEDHVVECMSAETGAGVGVSDSSGDGVVVSVTQLDSHLLCVSAPLLPVTGRLHEPENIDLSDNSIMHPGSTKSTEVQVSASSSIAEEEEIEEGEIAHEPGCVDTSVMGIEDAEMEMEKTKEDRNSDCNSKEENVTESPSSFSFWGNSLPDPGRVEEPVTRVGGGHLLDYGDLDLLKEGPLNVRKTVQMSGDVRNKTKSKTKNTEFKTVSSTEEASTKLSHVKKRKESEHKDGKDIEKKKRILTDERKAKKKLAKKRKRAETNKKLGIKRLKIKPVSMPKKVVYCNFYLNGRCQQGASCKFSHDLIPLTKSQPCKYFACNSCLKGDDCPFDHELGKYPCHNFSSKGFCIRGEACKFSHKVSATESSAEATKKCETSFSAEKITSSKLVKTNASSKSVDSDLTEGAMQEHLGTMIKPKLVEKAPLKPPKGIRFLSLDANLTSGASKLKDRPPDHAVEISSSQSSAGTSVVKKFSENHVLPMGHASSFSDVKSSAESCTVVQSSLEKFPTEVAKSQPLHCLPNVPVKKNVGNIVSSMAGTQGGIADEAARLLDEFLFSS